MNEKETFVGPLLAWAYDQAEHPPPFFQDTLDMLDGLRAQIPEDDLRQIIEATRKHLFGTNQLEASNSAGATTVSEVQDQAKDE